MCVLLPIGHFIIDVLPKLMPIFMRVLADKLVSRNRKNLLIAFAFEVHISLKCKKKCYNFNLLIINFLSFSRKAKYLVRNKQNCCNMELIERRKKLRNQR